MKKTYETPNAEKIMFQYRDQVVASSTKCVVNGEYSHFVDECDPSNASANYNK